MTKGGYLGQLRHIQNVSSLQHRQLFTFQRYNVVLLGNIASPTKTGRSISQILEPLGYLPELRH